MATGDFGPGRMPPDMIYNCNEEIKRQKKNGHQEPKQTKWQGQGLEQKQDQGQVVEFGAWGP